MRGEQIVLENQLKEKVESFELKGFNRIPTVMLELLAKAHMAHLEEFCVGRATESNAEDFVDEKGLMEEFMKYDDFTFLEFVTDRHVDSWKEWLSDDLDNYPGNICYEFRTTPSEETIQLAIEHGFGAIVGLPGLKPFIFICGGGYSPFEKHWKPFYNALQKRDHKF